MAENNVNNVTVQGVIVHKFVTPKIAILTIMTKTAAPKPNYPKVLFFGDLRDAVESDFEKGDHVYVTGNIQSSKARPGIKNQSLISVFGESIDHSQSVMEKTFNIDADSSYKPFINSIELAGLVTRIECPTDNMIRMCVSVRKNGRQSFVTVIHYTNKPEEILASIHVNDQVYIVGSIQTPKKESNGTVKHYENYVAFEITKA